MRAGWNPARGNRKVGTKARGHGQDNRLTIPGHRRDALFFFERLGSCVVVERWIAGRGIVFLVEAPRPGWFHPCTIDDVCLALSRIPGEHLAVIDLVVMRQPTRKQEVISPVWGRAIFAFEGAGHQGAAIVLEAKDNKPYSWPASLAPDQVRELERLREDGHEVRRTKRRFEIVATAESTRNTVLYRTLLHELGHHVDRARFDARQWEGRTSMQKEDFAHRYAAEALALLRRSGVAPFARSFDAQGMRQEGLAPEWFAAAERAFAETAD